MTDKSKEKPQQSDARKRATATREERLAAALRANLGRRKSQARERAEDVSEDEAAERPKPPPSPPSQAGEG